MEVAVSWKLIQKTSESSEKRSQALLRLWNCIGISESTRPLAENHGYWEKRLRHKETTRSGNKVTSTVTWCPLCPPQGCDREAQLKQGPCPGMLCFVYTSCLWDAWCADGNRMKMRWLNLHGPAVYFNSDLQYLLLPTSCVFLYQGLSGLCQF